MTNACLAVRVRRGIARLAEALEDVPHREPGSVDHRDGADARVADDRGVPADELDAVRRDRHGDRRDHPAAERVDDRDPRLGVTGDERKRRAPRTVEPSERERGGCRGKQEVTAIHAFVYGREAPARSRAAGGPPGRPDP